MKTFLFLCVFPPLWILGAHPQNKDHIIYPWFTGPLITPTSRVVTVGHHNIEPYLYINNNIGFFNNHWQLQRGRGDQHNINLQVPWEIGLNSFMELMITPQFFYNYRMSSTVSHYRFGDLPIGLGFQLYDAGKMGPALRFYLAETFPTGQYEDLEDGDVGTDAGGGGSYITQLVLSGTKMWHLYAHYWLSIRIAGSTSVFSHVHVRHKNAYGGDATTHGWVYPGANFTLGASAELSLTQHWGCVVELLNFFALKTRFKGTTNTRVGTDSWKYQISMTSALEYNIDEHVGWIFGPWFSLAGKDISDFVNGIIAVNFYY